MNIKADLIQKYRKKTVGNLKAEATRLFNSWIRNRDSEYGFFVCISCQRRIRITYSRNDSGKIVDSNFHAGHYYPKNLYPSLQFDEHNVNGQCKKCNSFESGRGADYSRNLELKIGKDLKDKLDQKAAIFKRMFFKWDRIELITIIVKYKTQRK